MDLPLVLECVMQRPRILTGAAERTAQRFKATLEERRAAMLDGIIPPPLGIGNKGDGVQYMAQIDI